MITEGLKTQVLRYGSCLYQARLTIKDVEGSHLPVTFQVVNADIDDKPPQTSNFKVQHPESEIIFYSSPDPIIPSL